MKVKDISAILEEFSPLYYQESYDNCGLQVGDPEQEVSGILLCLDITEAVLDEAISKNCNLIIAHHPLLFSGLKKIAARSYIERIVRKAIKNDLSLYASHTNLDNHKEGVNATIAGKLGLQNTRILAASKGNLYKLFTYVPQEQSAQVLDALFAAGAGRTGAYSECSYKISGEGSFRASAEANPTIGEAGGARETVAEHKIEVLVTGDRINEVLSALFKAHPYEEVAYELIALQNSNQYAGAGMIGELETEMPVMDFLELLKTRMKTECVRYTGFDPGKKIRKVAVCGGSGSFLLKEAIGQQADILVTADFKYHQFFDADGKIVIADIGHYESEQFTVEIFERILTKKIPNFALFLSGIRTNPIKYYF